MKTTFRKAFFIYLFFLIILSLFTLIYSLLIYFGKINSNMKSFNTSTFIIGIVCFFLLGFISGNVAQKNGLLEGLVAALFIILITLIINLFVKVDFNFRTFVKVVTFLVSSSLGGVIGVNFRPFLNRK
ncbi:MAG TPA: TIGR04086 family membrane protein [Acholeplasmataceae bacterium]|nr:TIGR04086 family membrane protein [Acholeplasmataceae bacterium]